MAIRSALTTLTALLALLATLVLVPATASAQAEDPFDDPTVAGSGALWARGDGTAEIDMRGRFTARIDGDVTIIDHAGDLRGRIQFGLADRAALDQLGDEEAIGDTVLTDFEGAVHLRGSDFSIIVDGEAGLRAVGRGQAFLSGEGVYKTRNGDRMVWDGMVTLGDPMVEPAA